MKTRFLFGSVLALLLIAGLADVSAQTAPSFFTSRVKGTFELKFLPPTGGVPVSLLIDNQPVGFLPQTVYVVAGSHDFTFWANGEEPSTIKYPVKGDTVIPSLFKPKGFPLTITTNVANAEFALDGVALKGNVASVTAGNHTLTISAPGFQTATVPFTQPTKANALNVTLQAAGFPLTVNTNVPGAVLALDGVPFAGNTVTASQGAHTLTITAPGYQTATVPFTQPNKANTLNVNLIASTFPLSVNTNVPGASFALDGVAFAGNTVQAAAGNHVLTVSAPGFDTATVPFSQPAGANVLNVTLTASVFPLTVTTNVPGATLAIDGTPFAGSATSVAPGNHTLTVSAPGYQVAQVPFTQPSKANTLNVTLIAMTGTLSVNTDKLFKPGQAYKLFINNAEAKGGLQVLPPGTYVVRLQSGNQAVETTITLGSGQNLTLTPSVQWDVR